MTDDELHEGKKWAATITSSVLMATSLIACGDQGVRSSRDVVMSKLGAKGEDNLTKIAADIGSLIVLAKGDRKLLFKRLAMLALAVGTLCSTQQREQVAFEVVLDLCRALNLECGVTLDSKLQLKAVELIAEMLRERNRDRRHSLAIDFGYWLRTVKSSQ